MNSILARIFCAATLAFSAGIFAGEPVTPQPPTPPVTPPDKEKPAAEKEKPAAQKTNPPPIPFVSSPPRAAVAPNEILTMMTDLLNGDAAKRDAAGKGLVGKGAAAWRSLAPYVSHNDADIAKRAKDIRKQIEDHARQLFEDCVTLQGKMTSGPLTSASLDEVRKAWIVVFNYAPQPEIRQNAQQAVQQIQGTMGQVEESIKLLKEKEAELAAVPPPIPLARSAIHFARAQAFGNLHQYDEALKAAAEAFEAGGKESRLAPSVLKLQAELFAAKQDNVQLEAVCKKITSDYGESLEAQFALGTLVDVYTELKRWDEAVEAVKNFVKACPLDSEAQSAADNLLDTLMEKQRDYPRAYGFSSWLKGHLHASRIRPEVLKVLGACAEYPNKDYATAEAAYKMLITQYADVVQPAEVEAVLKRVKDRKEGRFPKEPKPTDEGGPGVLAQFLAAVRERDAKKLAATVPAAQAEEIVAGLTGEDSDLVRNVTFGDFIVKKVEMEGDKAVMAIDYYDMTTYTPHGIVEKAVKEKDGWKLLWSEPEEQINPTPVPQGPQPLKPKGTDAGK